LLAPAPKDAEELRFALCVLNVPGEAAPPRQVLPGTSRSMSPEKLCAAWSCIVGTAWL